MFIFEIAAFIRLRPIGEPSLDKTRYVSVYRFGATISRKRLSKGEVYRPLAPNWTETAQQPAIFPKIGFERNGNDLDARSVGEFGTEGVE